MDTEEAAGISALGWSGAALVFLAIAGFVGQRFKWWTASEFLPWAVTAITGLVLLASKGRVVRLVRSVAFFGGRLELIDRSINENRGEIKTLGDRIQNLQQQSVAVHAGMSAADVLLLLDRVRYPSSLTSGTAPTLIGGEASAPLSSESGITGERANDLRAAIYQPAYISSQPKQRGI